MLTSRRIFHADVFSRGTDAAQPERIEAHADFPAKDFLDRLELAIAEIFGNAAPPQER